MQLHIKCVAPFNTWEDTIPCTPRIEDVCKLMRLGALQYPQCHLTLLEDDGNSVIAYAKWVAKRNCHDLGVGPAWQWRMQKETHNSVEVLNG